MAVSCSGGGTVDGGSTATVRCRVCNSTGASDISWISTSSGGVSVTNSSRASGLRTLFTVTLTVGVNGNGSAGVEAEDHEDSDSNSVSFRVRATPPPTPETEPTHTPTPRPTPTPTPGGLPEPAAQSGVWAVKNGLLDDVEPGG